MNILSLGAGVQSSTLALMCAEGELPYKVDHAIFADTQVEPPEVYEWLSWLKEKLPFPVHTVTSGNLEEATFRVRVSRKNGKPYMKNFIPSFTEMNSVRGEVGMMPRKCTHDFKLLPIFKKQRELAGVTRKNRRQHLVNSLIGSSIDEVIRMKPSKFPWAKNVYPLVDAKISRYGCLEWMKKRGYPTPPRSACYFCPYHSDAEWRRMKASSPVLFQRAVEFERRMWETAKGRGVQSREYLHSSRIPLDQVDLSDEPHQKRLFGDFGSECEGMCGV